MDNVQGFIEKYYPKYSSCNEIAWEDDLQCLIDGQPKDDEHMRMIATDLLSLDERIADDFVKDYTKFMKWIVNERDARRVLILQKAIEGYLEQSE